MSLVNHLPMGASKSYFNVSVILKGGDIQDPLFAQGSSFAYSLNDSPPASILTLKRNHSYVFDQKDPSNVGHLLYFTTDPRGAGTLAYTQGVTREESVLKFVVPGDAPDKLYYACENHPFMGGAVRIT